MEDIEMMKEIMKEIETFRSLLQNIVSFIVLFCTRDL